MEIFLTPVAEKQYRHIPKTEQSKIKKKLGLLELNPQEGKKLSGSLSESRSLRAWPYRIIYWIDKKNSKIFVTTIAHRQGVYDG